MRVYAARHVLPVASPPVSDGAVACDGERIEAVGPRGDVLARAGSEAEVRDLGDVVILPGLVNAHTHLELSWMAGEDLPSGDYLAWVRALVERREAEDEAAVREAVQRGVEVLVARGTVAVADVSNLGGTVAALALSPLWAVVFHELLGFRAGDAEGILERAAERLDAMEADAERASGRVGVALCPHAAHTTSAPLLKALAGRSAACGSPLSVHVAESEIEAAFLRGGADEHRRLLVERGQWDERWHPPGQSPVDYLDRQHALSPRTLAVHCVHLGQRDVSRLQSRGCTVVTCPRSNERLGVGRTPVGKLLAAGIPVALGTDSLASAPDLDMFAEIAALLRVHPGLAPPAALRMATVNGAGALGLRHVLGTIEPGKAPALIVVPLDGPGDDPLRAIVSEPETVRRIEDAPWDGGA